MFASKKIFRLLNEVGVIDKLLISLRKLFNKGSSFTLLSSSLNNF